MPGKEAVRAAVGRAVPLPCSPGTRGRIENAGNERDGETGSVHVGDTEEARATERSVTL